MSERAFRWVLAVVGLLVLAYGAVTVAGRLGGDGPDDPLTRFLRGVHADSVESVRIAAPAGTLRLRRVPGGWTVNGHAADSARVARLFSAMADAEVGEVVSRNPENHASMGVTVDSARTLAVEGAAGGTGTLHVGRRGPVSRSAYVRVDHGPEVFVVRGGLRSAVTADLEQWRDKAVVRVDSSSIGTVLLRRGDRRYRLDRGPAGWRMDGSAADSAAVTRLLDALQGTTSAVGFSPDTVTLGETDRELTLLDLEGDTLSSLRFHERGERRSFHVTRRGDGAVLRLGPTAADRLVPGPEDLGGDSGPGR